MRSDPACIFCRISCGEIPAKIILRAEACIAFLDINPLSPGHLLVIPTDHYATLADVPADVLGELARVLPRLGRALLAAATAPAFNLLQNNGPEAGQVVEHVHFHMIPRQSGDGLGYRWNAGSYPPGKADLMAESLRREVERQA